MSYIPILNAILPVMWICCRCCKSHDLKTTNCKHQGCWDCLQCDRRGQILHSNEAEAPHTWLCGSCGTTSPIFGILTNDFQCCKLPTVDTVYDHLGQVVLGRVEKTTDGRDIYNADALAAFQNWLYGAGAWVLARDVEKAMVKLALQSKKKPGEAGIHPAREPKKDSVGNHGLEAGDRDHQLQLPSNSPIKEATTLLSTIPYTDKGSGATPRATTIMEAPESDASTITEDSPETKRREKIKLKRKLQRKRKQGEKARAADEKIAEREGSMSSPEGKRAENNHGIIIAAGHKMKGASTEVATPKAQTVGDPSTLTKPSGGNLRTPSPIVYHPITPPMTTLDSRDEVVNLTTPTLSSRKRKRKQLPPREPHSPPTLAFGAKGGLPYDESSGRSGNSHCGNKRRRRDHHPTPPAPAALPHRDLGGDGS